MISGLSAPTSGSYEFHSNDSSGIGVLIESPGIYANRSAFDNLKIKCIGIGAHVAPYYWPSAVLREFAAVYLNKKSKRSGW